MIKYGFYIPERLQIKTIKKTLEEDIQKQPKLELKLKSNNSKNEIILPSPTENLKTVKVSRKMIRKKIFHLKKRTYTKLTKTNKKIRNIIQIAEENKEELIQEEKKFLEKTKEENNKGKKEIDDWLEFILSHTKELIASYEQRNDMNIEKLKEIEKKLGNFKKGETLIKFDEKNGNKKVHEGIYCSQCKENVVGTRYKCIVCKDFNYCEKCEDQFKEEHGHPMLKINSPEMCPISLNCSLISDKQQLNIIKIKN